MAWKGIKHRTAADTVGTAVDSIEWASAEIHELANGEELPETGEDGDFFYNTTDKHLYIWHDD